MDVSIIILAGAILIFLLLAVFMLLLAVRVTAKPEKQAKHKAKGHSCKECLFCKDSKCVYFHEESIDVERPACIHYEEKEEYRPA